MKSEECFLLFLFHEPDVWVFAVEDTDMEDIQVGDSKLWGRMSEVDFIFT